MVRTISLGPRLQEPSEGLGSLEEKRSGVFKLDPKALAGPTRIAQMESRSKDPLIAMAFSFSWKVVIGCQEKHQFSFTR